jgi:para-aminobenzoate synthetase component 1
MFIGCRIHFKAVSTQTKFAALTEVFACQNLPSILGGNDSSGFSVWGCDPVEVFEFSSDESEPLEKLDELLNKYTLENSPPAQLTAGAFCGGWMGYFGYELGRYIESIPTTAIDDLEMPVIRLAFYDKAIVYDHKQLAWYMVALEVDGDDVESKFELLDELLLMAEYTAMPEPIKGDLSAVSADDIKRNMTKQYYLDALDKTRTYIYDGDVYQINFSQRFECDYTADPVDLYHWQNCYNPSPYAAFIQWADFAIVSASPELFVSITGDTISTKPIKGTRPRLTDGEDCDAINKENFRELVESEKDQAELNMIIDLERNDLTRFCKYGTIKVTQPRTIEEYPTVYHAVSTIEGQLAGGVTFSDILRGSFPGGSITGAPKIRSMEIIDELEPTQRGVYTGSIGFIGIDGSVCLNIAIRTIIIKDSIAYAQSGGGIVADSDPESEWQEMITKARALITGIDSVQKKI